MGTESEKGQKAARALAEHLESVEMRLGSIGEILKWLRRLEGRIDERMGECGPPACPRSHCTGVGACCWKEPGTVPKESTEHDTPTAEACDMVRRIQGLEDRIRELEYTAGDGKHG